MKVLRAWYGIIYLILLKDHFGYSVEKRPWELRIKAERPIEKLQWSRQELELVVLEMEKGRLICGVFSKGSQYGWWRKQSQAWVLGFSLQVQHHLFKEQGQKEIKRTWKDWATEWERTMQESSWTERCVIFFFFPTAKLIYKSQAEFVKEVPPNVINSWSLFWRLNMPAMAWIVSPLKCTH